MNTLSIQPELKAQPEPKGQPSCPPESDQLVEEYSDIFQEIGKLKDCQLDLHINKDWSVLLHTELQGACPSI